MNRMLDLATAVGKDVLLLQSFSGTEELSRLFEYRLDMISENPNLSAKDLLGTNATVQMEVPGGKPMRHFNGYFSRFASLGAVNTPAFKSGLGYRYQGTLSPWLWFLTRTSTSQIFCDQTFHDVMKKVLGRWTGIAEFDDNNIAANATEKRDYITQYRETDFNFISRLAEQAGIYYYFTHQNGKHTLVFINEVGKHLQSPDLPELNFEPESRDAASITRWDPTWELQPGAVASNDFNPLTPRTSLIKVQSAEGDHANKGFELYDYPGEFKDTGWAEKYAKFRVEELFCRHVMLRGGTQQRTVQVGHKLKIQKHPIAARNGDYMAVAHQFTAVNNLVASSSGEGATFDSQITSIPAKVQFRAARVTPKPTIAGPQTAFVVGPAGEEIYTDEHARVRVQFHWDRYAKGNDKDSCWLRVTQDLAGKGWGAISIPRVGQEVVVSFLEGDPDRPFVSGRVYNGDTPPPYKLPDEKTRTGLKTRTYKGGAADFNELRFDDKTGEEQIYLQAQRNLDNRVKNQWREFIGEEAHRIVKKDLFEKHDADHHVDVTGDHNHKIGGSLSYKVTQDHHLTAASSLVKVTQEIHLKSDQKIVLEAGTEITLKVGGNYVRIDSAGVSVKGIKVALEGSGAATMKGGGTIFDASPAMAVVKGPIVMINAGGSATATPASAGSGKGAAPIAAKEAKQAMSSAGGQKDTPPEARTAPKFYGAQASSFKTAAQNGTPFCEVCENC